MSDHKLNCWRVNSVFGYTLRVGVIFVGVATIMISALTFMASIASFRKVASRDDSYNKPVEGADLIFSLYCVPMSTYQIVISALLLWKIMESDGDVFFCTLWYVSHLSITGLYCILFIARSVACFTVKQYMNGISTIMAGCLYTGVFIYFCLVVNSYSYSIDEDMFY